MPGRQCPPVIGKVTWQPSLLCWAAHSKSSEGKTVVKRFVVPKEDVAKGSGFLDKQAGKVALTLDAGTQSEFGNRRCDDTYQTRTTRAPGSASRRERAAGRNLWWQCPLFGPVLRFCLPVSDGMLGAQV